MQRVAAFLSPQTAFGLELNALSNDQTPFPHAVTMVLEGMTKARIPLMQVGTHLASVLSPRVLLEPLLLCGRAGAVRGLGTTGKGSSVALSLQCPLR